MVSDDRVNTSNSTLTPENAFRTGHRADFGIGLPVFLAIHPRRPVDSFAIPLIQKHFLKAMPFRQSVASTG